MLVWTICGPRIKKSHLDPSFFLFILYLNLNINLSKITKKSKDLNIFTYPCHYYPIQNPTHPKPDPTNLNLLLLLLLFFSIDSFYFLNKIKKVFQLSANFLFLIPNRSTHNHIQSIITYPESNFIFYVLDSK